MPSETGPSRALTARHWAAAGPTRTPETRAPAVSEVPYRSAIEASRIMSWTAHRDRRKTVTRTSMRRKRHDLPDRQGGRAGMDRLRRGPRAPRRHLDRRPGRGESLRGAAFRAERGRGGARSPAPVRGILVRAVRPGTAHRGGPDVRRGHRG